MAFKFVILAVCLAYANAGLLAGPAPVVAPAVAYSAAPAVSHVSYSSPLVSYGTPTLTSQSQNTYRSFGNLGQISTYSKTIDTPYSSVSKSDVRVSNPGLKTVAYAAAPAPLTYAHQPAHVAYHAPAQIAYHAAPQPAIGVAYSAAPAVAHVTYSNNLGVNYGW